MAKAAFIAVTIFFVVNTAAAAEIKRKTAAPSNSLSLAANVGGYLFAGSEHLQAQPLYGVKLSYDIIRNTIADSIGVEASFNYILTRSTRTPDHVNGYLIRLDATYPFLPRAKLIPFIAVGAGGIFLRDSISSESPLLNYGGGLKYTINEYLAWRVDIRHLFVYKNAHTHNNFELGTGLSYSFGKEAKQKVGSSSRIKP